MRYFFIALCLTACAAERQPGDFFGSVDEGSEWVVDGVLLVDQPLPPIFVRRVLPASQLYSQAAAGVADARVQIVQGSQVFEYAADEDWPGRYVPPPAAAQVEAQTEYRLEVEVEGKRIQARTTTPDRVRVRETVLIDEETLEVLRPLKTFAEAGDEVYTAPENQLVYREDLLEIRLENAAADAYQLGMFATEPNLKPLDDDILDFFDEDDPEALRANQSPPLSVSDGIMRMPWLAVLFEGRTLVKVYALDHNWFEYARSSSDQQEQGGFAGGLAGENFERPFFEVEGGIGLFGSASVDSVGFSVAPRSDL